MDYLGIIKNRRFCRACGCEVKNPCEIKNNRDKPDLTLILKRYIPEFDIEVDNACLCEDCTTTLYTFHDFKRKCMRTEENVRLHRREHPEVEIVNLYDIFVRKEASNDHIETVVEIYPNEKPETVTTSKKVPCKLCNRVMTSKRSLGSHMRYYHKHERYKCTKCSRDFLSEKVYNNHVAYHETLNSDRFICKECNFVYKSSTTLNIHNMCKHTSADQKPFQCELCKMKFVQKSSLIRHMKLHEKKSKYKCTLCDYSTNINHHLNKHLTAKHNVNDAKVECNICFRLFSKSSLWAHKRIVHGGVRYNCTQCNRTFGKRSECNEHLALHKKPNADNFMCKECNLVYYSVAALNRHNLSKHMSADQKPFQSEVSGIKFVQKSSVIKPIKLHEKKNLQDGKNKYECSLCDYTTNINKHLTKHLTAKHNVRDTAKVECNICHRLFSKYSLWAHKRVVHGGVRYNCTQCNRTFGKKSQCNEHLALHKKRNADNFMCKECNLVYYSVAALNTHNISKHMSADQKLFQCEVCGMKFAQKSSVITHMQLHEEKNSQETNSRYNGNNKYKCSLCDYTTNINKYLNKHLTAKHNFRDAKVECNICLRLLSKRSLWTHKRVVHGGARYNCNQCNREFITKKECDEHLEYHKTPNADRFKCKICNFVYHSIKALQVHQLRTHFRNDQRPLQSVLDTHKQTRTATKRFKCSLCNYIVSDITTINNHFRLKHKRNANFS